MGRQWHVGALAALTAVALLPGSPLAHAAAEKAPPVVTVALDGSKATLRVTLGKPPASAG